MSAAQLLNPKAESRVGSHLNVQNTVTDPYAEARGSSPSKYIGGRRPAAGVIKESDRARLSGSHGIKVLASNLGPRGTLKM